MSLRRVILLCVAIALLACATARAEDRWLFVPVFDTLQPQQVSSDELTAPFERNFSGAVTNGAAASLFEAKSSEAKELSGDELDKRMADLDHALEQLASGHRAAGERKLRSIRELGVPQRDYLRRAPDRAQKLFEACVFTAHLLAREKQQDEAMRQMVSCIRDYPGFQISTHPPELRELLERAHAELAREPTGELSVQSSGHSGCVVRLNGLPLGVTPVTLREIPLGPASVQVECDAGVLGRIHVVDVEPRPTAVTIDPRFDAAVSALRGLSLRYGTTAERIQQAAVGGAQLGRALEISHIVLLLVAAEADRVTVTAQLLPNPPLRSVDYRAGAFDERALQQLLVQLKGGVAAAPTPIAPTPVLVAAQLQSEPDEADESEPTRPGRDADATARVVIAAAMSAIGAVSLATSWIVYAGRQDFRLQTRSEVTADVTSTFEARGSWSIGSGIFGSALLTGAEFVWLPETTRAAVPTWAWFAGAAGLAGEAIGVGFAAGGTHCVPTASSTALRIETACARRTSDDIFGWNIALDALPLLTLPLSFAVRGWLAADDVQVAVAGPGLSLRGRF